MNPIDLRELHVVVKQGLSDDVQDALPLCRREKQTKWVRYHQNYSLSYRAGIVYSYRGENETLGPGVSHLNLLQCSHHCLHFGRVASLTNTGRGKLGYSAIRNQWPESSCVKLQ